MDIVRECSKIRGNSGIDFSDDVLIAIILCLAGQGHLLVSVSPNEAIDYTNNLVSLLLSNVLGLTTSVINVEENTVTQSLLDSSIDELNGIKSENSFLLSNCLVISNLQNGSRYLQAAILDLIRVKNFHLGKNTYSTQRNFIIICIVPSTQNFLFNHLYDHFFISHHIDALDYSNAIKALPSKQIKRLYSIEKIKKLRKEAENVYVSAEIRRYIQDILVFLRMHRAVKSGVSAYATRDFDLLTRLLCPLQNLNYATPAIVAIAVRRLYSHRIVLGKPQDDRSLLWGSDIKVVESWLSNWTVDMVIDDILNTVISPL